MIRVVIDTNVLVSGLLTSGGLPEAVINLAISGELTAEKNWATWINCDSVSDQFHVAHLFDLSCPRSEERSPPL